MIALADLAQAKFALLPSPLTRLVARAAGMLVNPTCAGNVQAVGFPKYTDLYDGLNAGKFGAGKVDYVV